MTKQQILVPDIGDYDDVPVIEVLVKVGDRIEKEQPLLVLESDKATIEVPADAAGIITSIAVKVDDKVKKGTVIAEIELDVGAAPNAGTTALSTPASTPTPSLTATPMASAAPSALASAASAFQGKVDHECELLVFGAGPGGYSAAFRAADLGINTILLERLNSIIVKSSGENNRYFQLNLIEDFKTIAVG